LSTGILLNIRSRYTSLFENDLIASWEHEFDYFFIIFLSFNFAGTAQLFVGSLLGKMTTEKMNGLFQMDGTDVTAVLMSCLSRPLDLPLGTSFWSQNRSFHKIMPIRGFRQKRREMQQVGWFSRQIEQDY
jgi:hypothetical protein